MTSRPEWVAAEFAAAWNSGDADRLAALFVEDADFVNVVGLWWHRREDIRRAHDYGFTHIFPGSTMTVLQVRTRALSADAAVVQAKWQVDGQRTPEGEPAGRRRGIITFVGHRDDQDGWWVVTAHNTDVLAGAETLLDDGAGLRPRHYRGGGDADGPSAR